VPLGKNQNGGSSPLRLNLFTPGKWPLGAIAPDLHVIFFLSGAPLKNKSQNNNYKIRKAKKWDPYPTLKAKSKCVPCSNLLEKLI
jgi:hypothetical protein